MEGTDESEDQADGVTMRYSGVSYRANVIVVKLNLDCGAAPDRLSRDGVCDFEELSVLEYIF